MCCPCATPPAAAARPWLWLHAVGVCVGARCWTQGTQRRGPSPSTTTPLRCAAPRPRHCCFAGRAREPHASTTSTHVHGCLCADAPDCLLCCLLCDLIDVRCSSRSGTTEQPRCGCNDRGLTRAAPWQDASACGRQHSLVHAEGVLTDMVKAR